MGGVPKIEVVEIDNFWQNYDGFQQDAYASR
jgi:hypothetical protein